MKALKLSSTTKDRQILDAKCKDLLTRAEKIKEAKDWLPAERGVGNLSYAQRPRSRAPVSTRKLATREEIILLEGAKLHGYIFPPWVATPGLEEFQIEGAGSLYRYVSGCLFFCRKYVEYF